MVRGGVVSCGEGCGVWSVGCGWCGVGWGGVVQRGEGGCTCVVARELSPPCSLSKSGWWPRICSSQGSCISGIRAGFLWLSAAVCQKRASMASWVRAALTFACGSGVVEFGGDELAARCTQGAAQGRSDNDVRGDTGARGTRDGMRLDEMG